MNHPCLPRYEGVRSILKVRLFSNPQTWQIKVSSFGLKHRHHMLGSASKYIWKLKVWEFNVKSCHLLSGSVKWVGKFILKHKTSLLSQSKSKSKVKSQKSKGLGVTLFCCCTTTHHHTNFSQQPDIKLSSNFHSRLK